MFKRIPKPFPDLQITSQKIVAKQRKLKVKWLPNAAVDLMNLPRGNDYV